MTSPRSQQIDLDATLYYHCMSRCVRRAYLCGQNFETGENYEHRRSWIRYRMQHLSSIFGIKVCAYAIMNNHYHLVLYVDRESALKWTETEVLDRWGRLFPADRLKILSLQDNGTCIQERIAIIRNRLMSISWFMKSMNEWIARESNLEDNCEGHFWEKRFKSQALLDNGALLSAMAYVDLNPIHAGISNTPEHSDFTSIQQRIRALEKSKYSKETLNQNPQPSCLMPFYERTTLSGYLPFLLSDYLMLIDQTGRIIRNDKKGFIQGHLPPILERLKLNPGTWIGTVRSIEEEFSYAIGSNESIRQFSKKIRKRGLKGTCFSQQMYANAS